MRDLDQIRADIIDMHAHAQRMQRESRTMMGRHAGPLLPLADYVAESERSWGWIMERCHDLEAQIKRIAATDAPDGARTP